MFWLYSAFIALVLDPLTAARGPGHDRGPVLHRPPPRPGAAT